MIMSREWLKRIGMAPYAPIVATVWNLAIVYAVYSIARVAFLLENWSLLGAGQSAGHLLSLMCSALVFDTSAIVYTNVLWLLLTLLPWHGKETSGYHRFCKWLWVVVNSVALVINLADSVYFPFTLRRTTSTVMNEFANEHNLAGIICTEVVSHWYLVLLAAMLIWAMWKLYLEPGNKRSGGMSWWKFDLMLLAALLVAIPLCLAGMRGGFSTAVRPITVSNANQYVSRPVEAALVLNTPFALIRTAGKNVFTVPEYYKTEAEMAAIYSPLHQPQVTGPMKRKNVVVFIIESFGREYIGAYNRHLDGGRYKGYTPFLDSLISISRTYRYSYCNGRKSIDGMPSILSGIPMFVEPFFLTPASMNHVSGIADVLSREGYETAFFHGAQNGSMGFQAFAHSTGFAHYLGRTEFNADKRFRGDKDFDGTWAIWDEPFFQFYCTKMNELREPFMTAIFTASSHHPFDVPEQYRDVFKEEGLPIHKCVRYTDLALRRFFESARRQSWFGNTLFVLTSDHTNMSDHAEYQTDLGGFCSPIIIYDPSGEIAPGMDDKVAQQIDIMPTILSALNYGKPYVAFGCDLLTTAADDTWAVNYLNGVYQYVKRGYVLQWDGTRTKAVYALSDRLMKRNLAGKVPQQAQMEREVKAIIQQYMERMTQDRLVP